MDGIRSINDEEAALPRTSLVATVQWLPTYCSFLRLETLIADSAGCSCGCVRFSGRSRGGRGRFSAAVGRRRTPFRVSSELRSSLSDVRCVV